MTNRFAIITFAFALWSLLVLALGMEIGRMVVERTAEIRAEVTG